MATEKLYIVAHIDREDWRFGPMGEDPDCKGGLLMDEDRPVYFHSRKEAQRAIRISKANARLKSEQGALKDSDFLDGAKMIEIIAIMPAKDPANA